MNWMNLGAWIVSAWYIITIISYIKIYNPAWSDIMFLIIVSPMFIITALGLGTLFYETVFKEDE